MIKVMSSSISYVLVSISALIIQVFKLNFQKVVMLTLTKINNFEISKVPHTNAKNRFNLFSIGCKI